MSLDVHSADPVVLGGGTSSGIEEKPQIRYEITDRDGVTKVTAVMSRRIHCLAIYAEAIKQSSVFPGQIVEVAGVSYGAGWTASSVGVVPDGEMSIVQIECRREGVTPFEWGLPPKMSMQMEDGVATLIYTNTAGTPVQMLQWDSQTGEDRYGWRVDYVPAGLVPTKSSSIGWKASIPVFDVAIFYENVKQFQVNHETAGYDVQDFIRNDRSVRSAYRYPTQAAAAAAGAEALAAFLEQLDSKLNKTVPYEIQGTAVGYSQADLIQIFDSEATVTEGNNFESLWRYVVTVPCLLAVYSYPAIEAQIAKGVYWESVSDLDAESATYQHVFYRLCYARTVLFAIDVTVAEGLP